MTERRDVARFCEELFNPKSLKAKAVLCGRDNECTALTLAEKKFGVNIDQAGAFHHSRVAIPRSHSRRSHPLSCQCSGGG